MCKYVYIQLCTSMYVYNYVQECTNQLYKMYITGVAPLQAVSYIFYLIAIFSYPCKVPL